MPLRPDCVRDIYKTYDWSTINFFGQPTPESQRKGEESGGIGRSLEEWLQLPRTSCPLVLRLWLFIPLHYNVQPALNPKLSILLPLKASQHSELFPVM